MNSLLDKKQVSYLALVNCFISLVHGHGRLVNPPGRASMWRYGFDTPVDFNDNQLFCGGFNIQHFVNGGKCGVCGDEYGKPPLHEPPGLFATGTISKTYIMGSNVTMHFEITASHRGYLEFRICPNNNVTKAATQDCLDQYLLSDIKTGGTKFYFNYGTVGLYAAELSLPPGLTCSQCVVQWRYHTGNSWGCIDDDVNKGCGIGLGRQEEFYACADVSIVTQDGGVNEQSTTSSTTPASTTSKQPTPTTMSTSSTTSSILSSIASSSSTLSSTSLKSTTMNSSPPQTAPSSSTVSSTTTQSDCIAIGAYKGDQNMDRWCKVNCNGGYCPSTHCSPNCNPSSTSGPVTTISKTTVKPTTITTRQTSTSPSVITTSPIVTTTSSSVKTTPSSVITTSPTEKQTSTLPSVATTLQSTVSYCPSLDQYANNPSIVDWCRRSCIYNYCSPYLCKCRTIKTTTIPTTISSTTFLTTLTSSSTTEAPPTNKLVCIGAGAWKNDTAMASWCDTNCKLGHCPPSTCQCSKDGSLQDVSYGLGDKCYTVMTNISSNYKMYMDLWCKHNCPSFGCWNIPNICKC